MRRIVIACCFLACGADAPATTFDAGDAGEPPPAKQTFDASPGPNDALDASVPVGAACTPGSVRIVASIAGGFDEGPLVDDAYVYWLEGEAGGDASEGYWWAGIGAVHRADKLGGGAARLFSTDSRALPPHPLFAIDASSSYWIDTHEGAAFGDVMRGDPDGSSPTPLAAGLASPRALEVAGGTVFFASGTSLLAIDTDGSNERTVASGWSASEYVVGAAYIDAIVGGKPMRVARSGGALEPLLIAPTPGGEDEGRSRGDDGDVYAVALTEQDGFIADASVVRIPTDGGSPTKLGPAIAQEVPSTLRLVTAIDGACVYYSSPTGVFRRCNGDTQAIGPGPAVTPFAIDSTSVYWAVQNGDATILEAWCKT